MLLSTISVTAIAELTDKEWQAKAVAKYPALGIQGSDLNKRFLAANSERRKTNPNFFVDPKWSLILADELAALSPPAQSNSSARPIFPDLDGKESFFTTATGMGLFCLAAIAVVIALYWKTIKGIVRFACLVWFRLFF